MNGGGCREYNLYADVIHLLIRTSVDCHTKNHDAATGLLTKSARRSYLPPTQLPTTATFGPTTPASTIRYRSREGVGYSAAEG